LILHCHFPERLPDARHQILSLQSLPSAARASTPELRVNAHGFSLHAAVRWRAEQRAELEQLCRYITRRPSPTNGSNVIAAAKPCCN
jgi:hypothetical protein